MIEKQSVYSYLAPNRINHQNKKDVCNKATLLNMVYIAKLRFKA